MYDSTGLQASDDMMAPTTCAGKYYVQCLYCGACIMCPITISSRGQVGQLYGYDFCTG
jgi:hypothetical protein